MEQVKREIPFYDESGGGVTFSGGEPLMQPTFLSALLTACREAGNPHDGGYQRLCELEYLRADSAETWIYFFTI